MELSCPLGWECHKCKWNVRLRGKNPQSNQEIDEENCALAWLPILLVELSQMERQTAMSVESMREHPSFQMIGVGLNRIADLAAMSRQQLPSSEREERW